MLLGAGISGGLGVLSSWLSARAASKAAKIQADAAANVGQQARDTAEQNAQDIYAAGERGATDVTAAAQKAGEGLRLSADESNALLRSLYGDSMAALEPYTTTGANAVRTLNAATGPGGDFNRTFTGADLETDPGYQFRLQEGAKALERSAAARGTLAGGRGLKEMERYSQGYASNEFDKAFDRFSRDRSERFGMLYNLSGLGMRATETGIGAGETYGGRAAGNIMTAGKYAGDMNYGAAQDAGNFRMRGIGQAGDYRMKGLDIWGNAVTGGANANAAGTVAASNAWSQGLSGIGNTVLDLAYLNARPTTPWNFNPINTGPGTVPGTTINPNNMVYDPATGKFVYKP
jgi:hypothetical protein